jgi:hypothetical protein
LEPNISLRRNPRRNNNAWRNPRRNNNVRNPRRNSDVVDDTGWRLHLAN